MKQFNTRGRDGTYNEKRRGNSDYTISLMYPTSGLLQDFCIDYLCSNSTRPSTIERQYHIIEYMLQNVSSV